MLKVTMVALAVFIGLSAPAQADTAQASEEVQHSIAPLESLGNATVAGQHGAIDALWRGHDSH
jgi:hypothetical protein